MRVLTWDWREPICFSLDLRELRYSSTDFSESFLEVSEILSPPAPILATISLKTVTGLSLVLGEFFLKVPEVK